MGTWVHPNIALVFLIVKGAKTCSYFITLTTVECEHTLIQKISLADIGILLQRLLYSNFVFKIFKVKFRWKYGYSWLLGWYCLNFRLKIIDLSNDHFIFLDLINILIYQNSSFFIVLLILTFCYREFILKDNFALINFKRWISFLRVIETMNCRFNVLLTIGSITLINML